MIERFKRRYEKPEAKTTSLKIRFLPIHTQKTPRPEQLPRFGNVSSHEIPWISILHRQKGLKPFRESNPPDIQVNPDDFYSKSSEPVIDYTTQK